MLVHTIKQHTMRVVTVCTLTMLVFPSLMVLPPATRGVVRRALVDPQALFESGRHPAAQGQVRAADDVVGERDGIPAVAGLLALITLAAGAYRLRHRHHPTKQQDRSIEQDGDRDGDHGVAEHANTSLRPSTKSDLLR